MKELGTTPPNNELLKEAAKKIAIVASEQEAEPHITKLYEKYSLLVESYDKNPEDPNLWTGRKDYRISCTIPNKSKPPTIIEIMSIADRDVYDPKVNTILIDIKPLPHILRLNYADAKLISKQSHPRQGNFPCGEGVISRIPVWEKTLDMEHLRQYDELADIIARPEIVKSNQPPKKT